MPPKFLRVRAVGEGEAAFACPRPDLSIRAGSRFIGRDAAGAIAPDGEACPFSFHLLDLIAQGQLDLLGEE